MVQVVTAAVAAIAFASLLILYEPSTSTTQLSAASMGTKLSKQTRVGHFDGLRGTSVLQSNTIQQIKPAEKVTIHQSAEPAEAQPLLQFGILGGVSLAAFFALFHSLRGLRGAVPLDLLKPIDTQPLLTDRIAIAASTGENVQERGTWWKSKALGAMLACVLVGTMLFAPMSADAANTAGRVGGSSFSSARSFSSSSRGSIGSGFRAPSVTTGPSVIVAPSFFPMTYGFGGYYGGGFGLFGGFGIFNTIFLISVVYIVFNFFQGLFGNSAAEEEDIYNSYGEPTGSVVKLQVGLLGLARDLQKDLETLASRADTDSPEGLHFVLQEAVLSLLRHPEYCVYGYSDGLSGLGLDRAEDQFNRESLAERGKFKLETLVNFEGINKRASATRGGKEGQNEFIVVTIIVAAAGKVVLPQVVDNSSLQDALKRLGGVRRDAVLAVEVLWTPQEEGDTFSKEEVVRDYPLLNRL